MPCWSHQSAITQLRHRPSSASQELGTRQDTDHLQQHKNWGLDKTQIYKTSRAHAATITTTTTTITIPTNLRQFLSSEPSVQSSSPSHTSCFLTHFSSAHRQSLWRHRYSAEQQNKLIAFIITCIHLHRHWSFVFTFSHLCLHCTRLYHHCHSSSPSLPASTFITASLHFALHGIPNCDDLVS